jgi:CARDB
VQTAGNDGSGLLIFVLRTARAHDLFVFRPQAGQSVYFDSGVENQGAVDSGVFAIKWLVDGQEVGAYGSHDGVPAKSTVMDGNSQFTWTFDSPGTYKLAFALDADDHVPCEANESDNVRYKTVQVQQAANEEEPEETAPTPEETPTTEPSETPTSAPTETTTAPTPEPSEAAKASTAPGTTPSSPVPFYTLAPTP